MQQSAVMRPIPFVPPDLSSTIEVLKGGRVKTNKKLAIAVAAILSAYANSSHAADAASSSEALQTVLVTATRREESIQDVPLTVQAFTAEQLSQLSVQTFDEAVKYLPNV